MLEFTPQDMLQRIPKTFFRHLLFIHNWAEPKHFTRWGADRRHELMRELRDESLSGNYLKRHNGINLVSKLPARAAAWVWFGSYSQTGPLDVHKASFRFRYRSSPRCSPRFVGDDSTYVNYKSNSPRRVLYCAFNYPFPLNLQSRLHIFPGIYPSDVSPYHCMKGLTEERPLNDADPTSYKLKLDYMEEIGYFAPTVANKRKLASIVRGTLQEGWCSLEWASKNESMLWDVIHTRYPTCDKSIFDNEYGKLIDEGFEDLDTSTIEDLKADIEDANYKPRPTFNYSLDDED